ncbi:MAG: tetratricopeptide repeat protein [Phycisphaeraceae bacterium]|nr:tetratricopeptide repeat protein [Phycisphaeraceae bacterium]
MPRMLTSPTLSCRSRLLAVLVIAMTFMPIIGCQSANKTHRAASTTQPAAPVIDTPLAKSLTRQASERLGKDDLTEAESLLRRALAADDSYGPAHNALGVLHYHQDQFHAAATEFDVAARLMPDSPEPRHNLGMVYEAVGQLDQAITWYQKALELAPQRYETVANLVRARYKRGLKDEVTRKLLDQVIATDPRTEWRQWAQKQRALWFDQTP